MKQCKVCGITIDDHSQADDICPGCQNSCDSNEVVRPQSEKFPFLIGRFLLIFIVLGLLYITFLSFIKDYRYKRIAAGYSVQWLQLETDAIGVVVEDMLNYKPNIRRKLFHMTTKHYLKALNHADTETKIQLIEFTPVIDSVYHSHWEDYNLGRTFYSYSLFKRIVNIAKNKNTPPELRQTAIEAVRKIGKPKPKYY